MTSPYAIDLPACRTVSSRLATRRLLGRAVAMRMSGGGPRTGACGHVLPCSGDVRRLRGRSHRDPHRLRPGRRVVGCRRVAPLFPTVRFWDSTGAVDARATAQQAAPEVSGTGASRPYRPASRVSRLRWDRRGQTGNVIYGVGACYSRYAGRVVTSYPARISGFGAWRDQPASLTLMSSPSEARSSASGSTSMSFA